MQKGGGVKSYSFIVILAMEAVFDQSSLSDFFACILSVAD